MGSFEIVEHTADVGFRARGSTLEELFEQATRALLEINGSWQPTLEGDAVPIEVTARDLGGLLVQWLSEVLYHLDEADAVVTRVVVDSVSVSENAAVGSIGLAPRAGVIEGTPVKAITYHQLRVKRDDAHGSGWVGQVYVDV